MKPFRRNNTYRDFRDESIKLQVEYKPVSKGIYGTWLFRVSETTLQDTYIKNLMRKLRGGPSNVSTESETKDYYVRVQYLSTLFSRKSLNPVRGSKDVHVPKDLRVFMHS